MRKKLIIFHNIFYGFRTVWTSGKIVLSSLILIKVVLGFMPVLGVVVVERFFDSVTNAATNNTSTINVFVFLALMALIQFFSFILNSGSNVISKIMSFKFEVYMKNNLFTGSKEIPYIKYEQSDFQNQYMRVLSSQGSILSLVENNLVFIQTTISLVSIVVYLVNIDTFFLSILVIMILPLIFIEMRYGKQRYSLAVELSESQRTNNYFESLLLRRETLKEIRINLLEDFFISKWLKSFSENSLKKIKLETKQMKWLIASNVILVISFIASGGFVLQMILQGLLTIGVLAAVIQAIQSLQGIIPSFTNTTAQIYESSLFVNDYRSFLPAFKSSKKRKITLSSVDCIHTVNLEFTYPGHSKAMLKDINFTIEPRDKIAIMGKNGSGKTTLVKCLIGLYETDKMIKVNNNRWLEDVNRESYWKDIGILFQDFNKYDLSAKDNIRNPSKSDEGLEKVVKAAKSVNMNEYIDSLPLKYETTLGVLFKEGQELSGGQWQKIALARAFHKQSNFLFLDEPTSALDSESEYFIINQLLKSIEKSSVIYITHRINVAMLADKIVIMDEGTIAEEGSHEELLDRKGIYYDLYHKQLNYFSKEKGGITVG